jgi:hypothetical protein
MRKIDPPPELTGRDFIIAGLVSVGILLVMIVVGTLSDPGTAEADELGRRLQSDRADQREDDHPRSSVSGTRPSPQHLHQRDK